MTEKLSRVWITKFAEKQIRKLPRHIVSAYHTWVRTVELDGIRATRTLPGYHDEPLKGDRNGVLEVNKHEY